MLSKPTRSVKMLNTAEAQGSDCRKPPRVKRAVSLQQGALAAWTTGHGKVAHFPWGFC